MKKYLVIEIQKTSEGVVSNIVTAYDDKKLAESAYYTILASAAVSELPLHTAMIIDDEGSVYQTRCYKN